MSDPLGIEEFEAALVAEGLSHRTARLYARDVRAFFTGPDDSAIDGLVPLRIKQWLDRLHDESYAAGTIARRLTSLRRYCRWLVREGELIADPTRGISAPSAGLDPKAVPRRVIDAVLVAPDPHSEDGIQDRAMMVVLAHTGMQLRELCALDISDCLDYGDQLIVGTGRRRRMLKLIRARPPLARYLYLVREQQDGEALFLSNRGRRISERTVQRRVSKHAHSVGVEVTVSDLIESGLRRRNWGDPQRAARELGFARPDVLKRKRENRPEPRRDADESDFGHPFVEPIGDRDPRGMPAPRRPVERPETKCDVWERLESQTVEALRLPRKAGKHWLGATGLIHLPPDDRLRAYAEPVSRQMARIREDSKLGRETPIVFEEALCRSDSWLIKLHGWLLAISPDLQMWAKVQGSSPEQRARTRRALRVSTDEPDPTEEILVWNAFGSPDRILDWTDAVLSTGRGQSVIWSLFRTRWDRLCWIRECASEYYGIPTNRNAQRELDTALVVACIAGLVLCNPQAVERTRMSDAVAEPAAMYLLDTVTYVLRQLLWLLGFVGDAPELAGIDDDQAFVAAFEREWDALLPYTNQFFGFAVVPRLHYEDMVRYHRLRYAPHGDLTRMPYEVGDYLVHQAKASGHFLRPFLPGRLHEAFFNCVRPLYDKLLSSLKYKARKTLTQQHEDQDGDEVFDRAERETEAAFRDAYDRYDFYHHPPGGQQTTITEGVLGWRRRQDIARLAGEMGIGCELARTPFAAYARGHLERLINRLRRDLQKRHGDETGHTRGIVVQGPDGQYYRTIESLARRVGRSASYLRDLDDLLEPVRVSDVFDGRHSNRKGLHDNTRLYRSDGESLDYYRELLREQHPRLAVEGLRTESQVAALLGVSVWWLRSRRERGLLEAGRKGHFVVYNATQRQAAERLLRAEMRESRKKSE